MTMCANARNSKFLLVYAVQIACFASVKLRHTRFWYK